MTLKDLMESDLSEVFLNTDEFSENVTYYPCEGEKRDISAAVFVGQQFERRNNNLLKVQTATIHVSNDSATGIDNPRMGDAIRLATDDKDTLWSFKEIKLRDSAGFVLMFGRHKPKKSGTRDSVL